MAKRTALRKIEQFTVRVHRQHSSLVVTLPKRMCELLDVDKGDIVVFSTSWSARVLFLEKLVPRRERYGKDSRNPDRKDQGG